MISCSSTRVMGLNNGGGHAGKQRSDERFFVQCSFPVGKQTSSQAYMPTAKYTTVIRVILEGLA